MNQHEHTGLSPHHPRADQFLRIADVERKTGLRKTSIYGLIKQDKFPKQITLCARTVVWPASAINRWIAERIAEATEVGKTGG